MTQTTQPDLQGMAKSELEHFEDQELENVTHEGDPDLPLEEERVYFEALSALQAAGVPFVVGGAFARHAYTGIWRETKDLDLFLKPADLKTALDALQAQGFAVEVKAEHWLAKATQGPHFVDLIFGTGHGNLTVDDTWIEDGRPTTVLGVKSKILPVEAMIASASYVGVRHCFDGAEVVHLIHGTRGKVNWGRVVGLLGENRQLLLWMLIFFDIIYPGHSDYLPHELMVRLFREMQDRWKAGGTPEKAFRGMLIDPFSFSVDVEDWGYEDRRDHTPLVSCNGEVL